MRLLQSELSSARTELAPVAELCARLGRLISPFSDKAFNSKELWPQLQLWMLSGLEFQVQLV